VVPTAVEPEDVDPEDVVPEDVVPDAGLFVITSTRTPTSGKVAI
jgi:hypothetical protein